MFMKRIYILFLLIGVVSFSRAQQLPHYSQYVINDFVMNPAIAGANDVFDAKLNIRDQWVGITDAPRTMIFSLNGPLNDKMGLGGFLYTDITGPTRRTGFQLSYAYHIKLNDKLNLSFGVSGGMLQYATDFSKTTPHETNDPALTSSLASVVVPDAGAGLYLYSKKLFFSISAPQIIPMKVQYFDDFADTKGKLVNHLYAFVGYRMNVGKSLVVEPSVMVKHVTPVPVQVEGTLRLIYNDMLWAGFSYRTMDAMSLLIGYKFQDNIMLGYSYDLLHSNLKNYSVGTHEIMIGVRFKNRTQKKETTPSFN
jgi:type IX secretion system PorP/SprF family membrane protein